MTGINARATFIAVLLGLAVVTQGQTGDYYIYQSPNGELVISNKEPPPGSKIIKRHSWPDVTDSEVRQGQQPKSAANVQTEGSAKPSKSK